MCETMQIAVNSVINGSFFSIMCILTTDRRLTSHSNGHISATDHPIHSMFGSRVFFRDGGYNGAISGSNNWKMAATAILEKIQMAISPQPVVRSTPYLVLGWGFGNGWSNGAISANHMFGQFTCLWRQHHITSLLMRNTLELNFVWEVSLRYVGYTVSRQEIKLQLLTGTVWE